MKLKYSTERKAIGGKSQGRAGFGGWTTYSTKAKTIQGVVRKMEEEAHGAFERMVAFYEKYPNCRNVDIFDEDHVWHFHTYAPLSAGVLHFDAFCVKDGGQYGEIESAYYVNGRDGLSWRVYKETVEKYLAITRD